MAGPLDNEQHPLNRLLLLAQAAGSFQGNTEMDRAYHKALLQASQNALAGAYPQGAGLGANVLATPLLAKLQQGGSMSPAQAWYAQTAAGRSGFGSGVAYHNEDLGKNF